MRKLDRVDYQINKYLLHSECIDVNNLVWSINRFENQLDISVTCLVFKHTDAVFYYTEERAFFQVDCKYISIDHTLIKLALDLRK